MTWGRILNFAGTDTEVSSFYKRMLASRDRPGVFYDVGGNIGRIRSCSLARRHKCLHRAEPCMSSLSEQACDLNGWECRIMRSRRRMWRGSANSVSHGTRRGLAQSCPAFISSSRAM